MLTIQKICPIEVDDNTIHRWVAFVLKRQHQENAEITLRFVKAIEIQQLNKQYRNKDKKTNILSFPSDLPSEINADFIGDIVLSPEVIRQEAQQQNKTVNAHFVHLIIHGILHLLGFDHSETDEAEKMESLEIELLQQLNFSNPY